MKNKRKNQKGFTIIEIMIAVALFTVIMTISIGALLNVNLGYKKSQKLRVVIDNLNYIMEDMSRNLRLGADYHCDSIIQPSSFPAPAKSCARSLFIVFKPFNWDPTNNPNEWIYAISANGNGISKTTAGNFSGFVKLNTDEITIDPNRSGFTVVGAEDKTSGNTDQPFVIIRLAGDIIYQGINTPFDLQTSISQRQIDI